LLTALGLCAPSGTPEVGFFAIVAALLAPSGTPEPAVGFLAPRFDEGSLLTVDDWGNLFTVPVTGFLAAAAEAKVNGS